MIVEQEKALGAFGAIIAAREARGDLRPEALAAAARFRALGLPTTEEEAWRFTSTEPIARTAWSDAPRGPIEPAILARAEAAIPAAARDAAIRLVFVDGRFADGLSRAAALPKGAYAGASCPGGPAGEAHARHFGRSTSGDGQAFVALNAALCGEVAFVFVPRGAAIEEPVHIVHAVSAGGRPVAVHPRTLIVLESGADAHVVEHRVAAGEGTYFANAVTEAFVEADARLEHVEALFESPSGFHFGALYATAGRSAGLGLRSLALGGGWVRNEVMAVLAGEGAEAELDGLYMAGGTEHVDNHTTIDHRTPHCTSREVYRGILDGRASGVFHGRIIVRPDAQKTDAKQTNKNLLLSDEAEIETKPQLEIYANDVKCTHGATVGRLDEEALFYLRSRAIRRKDARALLIYAFASDIVRKVKIPSVREAIERHLLERLGGRVGEGLPDAALEEVLG
jgi:Fe-S cluster assembly protein SufD